MPPSNPALPDDASAAGRRASKVVQFERMVREEMRHFPEENGYAPITAQHPSKVYAKAASLFEAVKNDPFVRQFLRVPPRRVRLFARDEAQEDFGSPAGDYMITAMKNNVIIGEGLLDVLTDAELKVMMAHEMSHLMRLDTHMKRQAYPAMGQRMANEAEWIPYMELPYERLADIFSVFITGDGQAAESGLRKALAAMQAALEVKNPGRGAVAGDKEREDVESRIGLIRETARRIATPEGRKEVEQELRAEYLGEHKKLFPRQFPGESNFSRRVDNTRAAAQEFPER